MTFTPNGDAVAGFEKTFAMSYKEVNAMLHEIGHAHPMSWSKGLKMEDLEVPRMTRARR